MTDARLVDMLVKNGMAVNEAVEAVADYTEADYVAEQEEQAREDAYWAEIARIEEDERLCADYEHEFFTKYIAGKSYDELDPEAYDFWSDLYKDAYGVRPRWYLSALKEAERKAEEQAVKEELEEDGWIFLDTPWKRYKRQLTPTEMTVWVWGNRGMTYEALCEIWVKGW